jgi:hypothetical protein
VLIEGFLNGEPQSEVLTSDGTTLVNSSLQFDSFAAFSKDKVNSTNGNFTVCSPDELTTYAIISAWEASPRYTAYRLPAVATAASTVYFIGKERFKPMLNKLSPPFMDGIAYALIDGAVSLANQEQNQTSSEDILAQTMAASLNDVIAKTEQSTLGRKIVRG